MRLLFIGDIVGKPGRQICTQALAGLRREQEIDLIVANAENAAGGSGITPPIFQELLAAGIDGMTLGDHVYKRREIVPILESDGRIVRPANYPPEAPGAQVAILTAANGVRAWRSSLGPRLHAAGRLPLSRGRPHPGRAAR